MTDRIKPCDDLSYYLGPGAESATAEQCDELERTIAGATTRMRAGPYIRSQIQSAKAVANLLRRSADEYERKAEDCRSQAAKADIEAASWANGTDYDAPGEGTKEGGP